MQTLRSRTRLFMSALFAVAMLAAVFAPMAPAPRASAEETRVMASEQVYVRSGPSQADAILGELQGGDWVTTTGYSENGYLEIYYSDYLAYVYADYISWDGTASVATETEAAPASTESSVNWTTEAWLYTNDSVNLRGGASTGDGVVTILPAGASVFFTGAYSNGFYQVESDYGSGWVHSDYLGSTAPAKAAEPAAEVAAPEPVVSSTGQQMVDFAIQYHGYPYVWAGNTPSGFDCSGFTQYVVQNVLGYDITHSTDLQAGYGTSVAWGEWQPGDLLFFVGTGGGGYISHVGIYIGDGQMIHAENPGTGVVISSVYSAYYSGHYYSATRL